MNINRTRISQQYLSDLIQGVKGKPRNRKVRDFLKKWSPTVKQNKLYVDGKQVVPYEDVDAVLKREAEDNGMPLSRDGAYFVWVFVGYMPSFSDLIQKFMKK